MNKQDSTYTYGSIRLEEEVKKEAYEEVLKWLKNYPTFFTDHEMENSLDFKPYKLNMIKYFKKEFLGKKK